MSNTRQFEQPESVEDSLAQDESRQQNEQYDLRFQGTRTLYGTSAVDTFSAAHVYIIGVGGVGSWAAEALARTAVGTISLIDIRRNQYIQINQRNRSHRCPSQRLCCPRAHPSYTNNIDMSCRKSINRRGTI